MAKEEKEWFENFKPLADFKVPDSFPLMLHNSVLIKRKHVEEKTDNGIVIPDNMKGINKCTGIVYATSSNVKDVFPGMFVVCSSLANQVFIHEEVDYMFMGASEVFGVYSQEGEKAALETMNESDRISHYFDSFTPKEGFKVPNNFLKPLNKHIIVKKEGSDELRRKSGIHLSARDEAMNKFFGTVLAIGPDVNNIKIGMRICINAFADTQIVHKGEYYNLISYQDALAIIPDGTYSMTVNVKREERKQYSDLEMPDAVDKDQKIFDQENSEAATLIAEKMKKEARRQFGFDKSKK